MERTYVLIVIVITVLLSTGCMSVTDQPKREFYENFSIGDIVSENEDFLLPGSRVLNGSGAGPPEPFIQRYEEISFYIDQTNQEAFFSAVKTDIQQAITESGAIVEGYGQGGGDDTDYFSYDYSHNQIYGTIHVWAVNSPDSRMNIIVLLTED